MPNRDILKKKKTFIYLKSKRSARIREGILDNGQEQHNITILLACFFFQKRIIVHVQKIFILPPKKGLEFPRGVAGSVRP